MDRNPSDAMRLAAAVMSFLSGIRFESNPGGKKILHPHAPCCIIAVWLWIETGTIFQQIFIAVAKKTKGRKINDK